MDALPDIGHACGHNLIAIAGVAIACALKAVLKKFDTSATVKLLGTPGDILAFILPALYVLTSVRSVRPIKRRKMEVASWSC